ncbi:epithelial-stromal interaction protein 1 [Pleurodeles waltl]|uniref:epithelial-stromal interaction protein 1 n=1 Tax=Pleurodeles waltl TaxID=8319 RepID=UPI00370955CE
MSATRSMTTRGRATQQGTAPGVRNYPEQGAAAHQGALPSQQGSPEPLQQREQHVGASGYHVIHPNEDRRNRVQAVARTEMEALERYREAHRPGPINLAPRRLGGNVSEYEARQQQQIGLRQSKYQQQLKREDYKKKQKEAEEAEIQKMKAIQREKANMLEQKRRQQEIQRRGTFEEDRYQVNNAFLTRLESAHQPNFTHQAGRF